MSKVVTFYTEENCSGSSYDVNYLGDIGNLKSITVNGKSLNDSIRSMIVHAGYYIQLCADADFKGDQSAFEPGTYNAIPSNITGKVSSFKSYSRCAAIMYTEASYKGNSRIINDDIASFDEFGFDNKTASVKVMPNCNVSFYSDFNYKQNKYDYSTSNTQATDGNKYSSAKVNYDYAATVYSGNDFSGDSMKLMSITEYSGQNFCNGKPITSLNVNPGYTVYAYVETNCQGKPQIFNGPCELTSTTQAFMSMKTLKTTPAVTAYSEGKAAFIELSKSNHDLNNLDWNNKISYLAIQPGYFVQICTTAKYSDDRIFFRNNTNEVMNIDLTTDDYKDYNKNVSAIRIIDLNQNGIYLFQNENYGGDWVKLNENQTTTTDCYWRGSANDGCQYTINDDQLSSVLVIGDYQLTMNDKDNNQLVLNGPGFFDLACYSRKSAADYNYLFNDKTNKITFTKYNPHPKAQTSVNGYSNYTYLRGDLHCHTLWSDAYYGGTPGYIDDPFNTFRIYQGLGHDFVGISDHTFGLDSNKDTYDQRYDGKHTDGNPRGVKYAMSHSEWLKTVKHSNRADHNYNFSSLAGVEMSYGGAAIDIAHNSPDEIAHFNAFGYDDIYYGQPGKWENTATSRTDVYRWAAETYKTNPTLIMQFNHPSNEGKGFNYFLESEAKDKDGNLYNRDPFRLCEFFTVSKKGQNRNYFRAYKKALAQGWKVAPTATSDNHDEIHELKTIYKNIRTVVVSENQSKESILNAMIARRVYATRIPKLNLFYSLTNSNNENVVMGGEITKTNSDYTLDFEISGETNGVKITSIDLYTSDETPTNLWTGNATSASILKFKLPASTQEKKYAYVVVNTAGVYSDDENDKNIAAISAPIWFK